MPGLTVHFEVLNQLNSPALYADTLANRPAAQLVGRIFFRTDSPFGIYRDTGSAWDLIASPDTTGITGTLAAGQVPYATGTSSVSGTNNLFWDSTNNRLGIGTATPGVALDIHGSGGMLHLNGTGTNNAFQLFQNAGTSKWRIGNNYSGATNYFSIYDNTNAVETLKITPGATNAILFTGNLTATTLIKLGGTSSQFLKADGSIDSNTYITTSTNIYNTDGTLTSNRTLTNGGFNLSLVGATYTNRFTSTGRLLLGTTTESTYQLDVVGTTSFSGSAIFQGTTTASGTIAKAINLQGTITAAANNDTLIGLDLNPTFSSGSFTGVTKIYQRQFILSGGIAFRYATGSSSIDITYNNTGGNTWITQTTTGTNGLMYEFKGTTRPGFNLLTSGYIGMSLSTDTTGFVIGNSSVSYPGTSLIKLFASSGNFCIGTTTDNAAVLLNMSSTTKGFLPPVMTTTQKNAITSPPAGLIIYDSTLNKLCVYSGTAWETITSI